MSKATTQLLQSEEHHVSHHLTSMAYSEISEDSKLLFASALRAARVHLKMEVAFVSEFADGHRYFRSVDCEMLVPPISNAMSDPIEESLCNEVATGRVPQLLTDALANDRARSIAGVRALNVRAHLSVPILLADNKVYGTFCCFSRSPAHELTERDLGVMRAFADMIASQVEKDLVASDSRQRLVHRVKETFAANAISTVYQPIVDLRDMRTVGFEALSRFETTPYRAPDVWFAEAGRVGLAEDLEVHAITLALRSLDRLPSRSYISVNASPATVESGRLESALEGVALNRVVVEITEHEIVHRYESMREALRPLQAKGLRVAIDDAGAGYASFRHILKLSPHMIKLDISITRDVHLDKSKRALAAALCRFTEEIGCRIVAEGVETELELQELSGLGFHKAQGYFLGRPAPLEDAIQCCLSDGSLAPIQ